jgi:hypothetical protein
MARTKLFSLLTVLTLSSCAVDQVEDETTEAEPSEITTTPVYPTSHPRIYLGAHRARLVASLTANTPAAASFKSKVNAWYGGTDIWGFGAWNGALLSQLSGDTKYCTKAVSVVEAQVAAAESKIAAGTNPEVALDSYLQVGEMIGDLAIVYDWCYAQVSSAQRTRWIAYANQAVSNVWNPSTAKWGGKTIPWSGWSIDNPSNNYYYSFLRATMLLGLATKGENVSADAWLTKFRDDKIVNQLAPTFKTDLPYGGSREGTGYGVAMRRLFELYDWWKATTGENLATITSHTRYSMLAMMHQIVPTLDRVAPTGDHARDSTAALFDYHRDYLLELMSVFSTDTLAGRAKTLLANSSMKTMSQSFMAGYDFLLDNPSITTRALTALNTAYYAKGIGQVYARSSWDDTNATWVNLTAGAYTESHAHQDQGSLMIYKGAWLAHDANVHSKSGLAQDTTAHSLVRIDSGSAPIKQVPSTISKVTALQHGAGYVYVSTDVTPAYNGNANIQQVQRELVYLEPNAVIVYDRVQSSASTSQTWQLVSPVAPAISGNTATFTNAGHALKLTRLAPASATMSTYAFTSNADFTGGYRLDQKVSGGNVRYLHVLSVDGGVTAQTAAGADGVTVTLSSGKQVTVTFNRDTAGGSIVRDGVTSALASTIVAIPQGL